MIRIRPATPTDIAGMAAIRASTRFTASHWNSRIEGYLLGEHHPQHALARRAAFVAVDASNTVVGLVAGHLSTRFGCDGELEWIDTAAKFRRTGVATALVQKMAAWFAEQNASRICIDVDPANHIARNFYRKLGATELDPHWLVWERIQDVLDGQAQLRPGETDRSLEA